MKRTKLWRVIGTIGPWEDARRRERVVRYVVADTVEEVFEERHRLLTDGWGSEPLNRPIILESISRAQVGPDSFGEEVMLLPSES